jgi:TP901 family phage tail tape measure protein
MADKFFKIAAILTAVDQMSAVFASASRKSMAEMDKMQKQMQTMRNASLMIGAGEKSIGFVKQFVDSSADMEEAGNKLKAVLMDKNGVYNADTYNQIEGLSQKLSNVYAQSAMDYLDAARVFKQNRIEPKDILGGVLESTAKLADYFDQMNPGQVALFASRMKNDFGVAANEMGSMMDLLARLKDSGVGGFNGSVAVEQMTQFFGKASLGMANMKNVGLQAAKELGTVGGYFISRGLSPETVGTNIRRIYDTLRNPERLGQMMQAAQKMAGVQLKFFGNDKQFLGMANFVQELGKLKGLDVQTIDSILSKPFGGKMGLSSEMATFLAINGTEKFKEFSDSIENQATLSQKLSEIMNGWNYVVKVIKSSFETLKQMFGKGLLPFLKEAGNALNEMIVRLQQFGSEYPRIAKFVLMFAGLGGLALIFGGIGSAIGVVISGLKFLGIGISGILRFIPQVALLACKYQTN